MSYGKYVHEYQKSAVNGASPLQLIIMLYDGSLRFMEAGKHAMLAKDLERQNTNLIKAQRIFSELIACLDMDRGGEVATNLLALYTFCTNQLVEANMYDRAHQVDTCMKIMSDLRESWVAIDGQQRMAAQMPVAA